MKGEEKGVFNHPLEIQGHDGKETFFSHDWNVSFPDFKQAMFSFQNRETSFCSEFSRAHHIKIHRCTDATVSSEESIIAAAIQNSSPGRICFKTCFFVCNNRNGLRRKSNNSVDTCLLIDCNSACDRSEVFLLDIRKRLAVGYR